MNTTITTPSTTTISTPVNPPTILILATTFCSLEMLVQLVALFVSGFNFALLWKTKLLHPNLKCILLVQSVAIASHELNRFMICILKFTYGDMFLGGPVVIPAQIHGMIAITFRNLISHVLMAERVLATVYFRKYSNYRKPHFSIAWISILLATISIWYTYAQKGIFWIVNPLSFANVCVLFILGLIGIVALAVIYTFNLRKYKHGIYLTLNERFQLSENIRTAKQLAPTLVLHYFNANFMNLVVFLIYFDFLPQPYHKSFAFLALSLVGAIACSAIEITVITHHPMIKRRAIEWIRKLVKFNKKGAKVEDSTNGRPKMVVENINGNKLLLNIHGRQLLNLSESEHHFHMLQQHWN